MEQDINSNVQTSFGDIHISKSPTSGKSGFLTKEI